MEKTEILELPVKKTKKRTLKKPVKILIFLIITIFVVASLLVGGFVYLLSPVSSDTAEITYVIQSGQSVYSVGKSLESKKIIRNFYAYKLYVKLTSVNNFKAGTYTVNKAMSTTQIIDTLVNNYVNKGVNVTFKEGKTIRNVAKIISQNTKNTEVMVYEKLQDKEYIDTLIEKYWFLDKNIKNNNIYYPLEGYLFPETYNFSENMSVEKIFEIMLDQSNKEFSKYKSLFDASSYSVHEIVTLASIIESEGIYKTDRKMISGVFYNRLNAGMALGSDVTTYYAFKVDMSERDLTKVEINTYNPYNTRGPQMSGKLPVGPISNFGATSLEAALNPTTNDYYYFVADKSGKTHFTKTYDEHLKVIADLKASGNWYTW